MRYKITDPRKYWQHIKPRNGRCDSDVAPAKFAEHFSQLYSSNNTYVTQNMLSEDDYDVQNEILDRKFTIYEVGCAINHLKCGKASGPDDIRNEYIKYEKQNLKLVLNQLFNMIYDTGIYPENRSYL